MVERRRVILMRDCEGMMHTAVILGPRIDCPIARLARMPAAAGAEGEPDLGTGPDEAHHLREIPQHALMRCVDLGRCFGEPKLRKWIF